MEKISPSAPQRALEILKQGPDMTLATNRPHGYPQATTVSQIHEGLTLYAGIGLGSQKAENIQADPRVSASISLPYDEWNNIRGLNLAAHAKFLQGAEDISRIAGAFLCKFPQIAKMNPASDANPLQSILFVRIEPSVISPLDYGMGFGHTEPYQC